ncbi:hypothetical protein [Cecembia sp.]|uniref:hypothetical protein n=1 Tax=Cecembia sp. TaxID=1898110 RepID=UPI0025BB108D|nr:hypothetical protein [Cecembia sp.]
MGLSTAAIATEQLQQVLRIQPSEEAAFSNKSFIEDWFQQSPFFMLKSQSRFDFPNFPETQKVFHVLYFEWDQDEARLKALFNGLILLGQAPGVVLEFQKELNTYALKYYAHNATSVLVYLQKLELYLMKDLRFKQVLSSYLIQERKHQQSQSLLHRELFAQ